MASVETPTDNLPATRQHDADRPRRPPQAHSVQDVWAMAEAAAASRMFPGIQTAQAAFTLMLLCQSEGLHPMQALKRYHIIEGRPSLRADAMQAEFQRRGGRIKWLKYDAREARAVFSHPDYQPEGVELVVTFEQFEKSGMTQGKYGPKDNWKNHPASMLRARLVSQGVRMVAPDIVAGIYTPEEVSDFDGVSEGGYSARVVEEPGPAPAVDNQSGYGKGMYASPEDTETYLRRLRKFIEAELQKWWDRWPSELLAGMPARVQEPLNVHQCDGHLLKWCVDTGLLDQTIVPEEAKVRQLGRYVAIVYHRSDQDREGLRLEMRRYASIRTGQAREAIYRKHPDLRPAEDETQDPGPEPEDLPDEPGARG